MEENNVKNPGKADDIWRFYAIRSIRYLISA